MNIINELAKRCDRQDCAFAFDQTGFSNAFGFYAWVTCHNCKRKWTIHKPEGAERAIYDRTGKQLNPADVEITEVTNR